MQTYILRMNGNKNSQSSTPSRSIRGESVMGMNLRERSNKPDPNTVVTTNLSEVTIEVKNDKSSKKGRYLQLLLQGVSFL